MVCTSFHVVILCSLAACGGGGKSSPPAPTTFTIGGSVSGLSGTVVLQQTGGNNLSVSADGPFTFAGAVAAGAAYAVTVLTQPAGQKCTVASGAGTANAAITNVAVTCVNLYTIGGTVSGLTAGAVVLQNNSGDDLSITANGPFTFATTIANGVAYSVSVSTQPPGPDCTVTGGSGSATTKVTSVSVVCSADPATLFLPLTATPTQNNTGVSNLYVVTSKSIALAPILVTDDWTSTLAFSSRFERSTSGELGGGKPATLVYAGAGSGAGGHVYALDLSGASTLVPRQVSSLTFDPNGTPQYCSEFDALTNVDDPDSTFLLLEVPTTPGLCGGGNSHVVRIRLADSASATPADVDVPAGTMTALHRPDGALAGLIVVDSSNRLQMYHDENFTTATTLLTGAVNFAVLPSTNASAFTRLSSTPTYALLFVLFLDGSEALYRVDYTRTISAKLYDVQTDLNHGFASDGTYAYFTDIMGAFPTVEDIFRVRLDGTSSAQSLYSFQLPDGSAPLAIMGVTGSALVLERSVNIDPQTGQRSADIQTLDTSGPGTPLTIARFDDPTAQTLVFKGRVFVSLMHDTPGGTTPRFSYSTEILNADGTIVQPLLANSYFLGTGADSVQRVRDIAPDGLRGGSLEALLIDSSSTVTATPLKRADGSSYTLTTSTDFGFTFGVAPTIGVGGAQDDIHNYGLIFDVPKGIVAPVTLPSMDVRFLLEF